MRLAELRRARRTTQVVLAQSLGVNQGEISKIEHRTDVYLRTLGGDVEGRSFEDARPAIDMVNAELAAEIRRSFDFFRSSSHSDTIHRVVLSGGCARLPGLVEYLSENLEIPSVVANPLRHIRAESKEFDPEYLEVIAPQLAVSVGLALRQAGDK